MIIYLIENTINNKIYIGQTINSIEYMFDSLKGKKITDEHIKNISEAKTRKSGEV